VDLEPEENWLRHRLRRLRTILRYAKEPRVESGLRELIADAEERLDLLERQKVPQSKWDADYRRKAARFMVREATGHALAYLYFEGELDRRAAAHLLTRDESRRIAASIAKLPELLQHLASEEG
jgi:hypothetical protein